MPIDLTGPFRGSAAVAAGLITPGVLRGPRYQRLFPDVHAPADLDPDLALRALAAGVLVAGRGVVAGHAAGELLGASCGAPDALVDVLMPGRYSCEGLWVHRDRFGPAETIPLQLVIGGLPPQVQYPVVVNGNTYRLDLAYPAQRVAVEYDGAGHRQQARARRDLAREADLAAAGWRVLRFDAHVVMSHPDRLFSAVQAQLAARTGR
jgi:hypothetical protein